MPNNSLISSPPAILKVRNLTKTFADRHMFCRRHQVRVLNNIDMEIFAGRTLALVGETGSGKSTLARCLVRLEEATSGEIWFEGCDFRALAGARLRSVRRQIQLIFQEAMSALNPRFSAMEIVAEPLVLAGRDNSAIETRVRSLVDDVGLPHAWLKRGAHQFSGGQKQRLALARALATDPKVIILDEALSGLDLSVQGQMVNLLLDLQEQRQIAYLFVTHDLRLAATVADEIAVLKGGSIVEQSSALHLFDHPRHPYTQLLLAEMHKNAMFEEAVPVT
jgi:ABC-type glutathione transport system ATPase component